MPIPQDILSVPRPKNTVVIAYGKDKSLFAVRQRVGCRNDNGRHLPVNGPTIGHIIDGVYIPIDKKTADNVSTSPVDLKDWANVVLSSGGAEPRAAEPEVAGWLRTHSRDTD